MNPIANFGAIHRCGVHVPRLRLAHEVIRAATAWANAPTLKTARGTRAVGNWDEDALTMAVEAARGNSAAATSVMFCSTTTPFADRDAAVLFTAALGLPESCETMNLGGSLRAGTTGFIAAARRGRELPSLVVASDMRLTRPGSPQEQTYGDAAVALLFGPDGPAALATVVTTLSVGTDFVDHYRMSGKDFDYAMEERWIRDESLNKRLPAMLSELLIAAGESPDAVRHFLVPASAATAGRLAKACGLGHARCDERALGECGAAGVATPLLMLAATLETAERGELILVVGLGQGVDALLLRATGRAQGSGAFSHALSRRHDETSYVRYLSHRGLIDMDFGMRAERDNRTAHTVAYRRRAALTGFMGGRCGKCGTVQFPLSRMCVNPACRETDTQAEHRLADSVGRVKSFTEDWQAYAARPPYMYGNVEFEEGGNLLMEFTDIDAGELKVADEVRFVFRIKDEDRQRGFRRYFWKATRT